MEVHCDTLAVMGATLANGGVCPVTREAALAPEAVRDVLSLMHSCGMYNYSGQVRSPTHFNFPGIFISDPVCVLEPSRASLDTTVFLLLLHSLESALGSAITENGMEVTSRP